MHHDVRTELETRETQKARQARWKEANPHMVRMALWVDRDLRKQLDEAHALIAKEHEARGLAPLPLQTLVADAIKTWLSERQQGAGQATEAATLCVFDPEDDASALAFN